MAETPPEMPKHWRWFSPLAQAVVDALADGQWQTTERVAESIGESRNHDLRAVIRDLVERGVLLTCNRRGIRINDGREAREGPAKG